MEKIIEIHDSTLAKIEHVNSDLILHFDQAYVIHSKGEIKINGGSGFVQTLDLILQDVSVELSTIEVPIDLYTGHIIMDGIKQEYLIPLPLIVCNDFKISVSSIDGGKFIAKSKKAFIKELSEPKFVENIPKA